MEYFDFDEKIKNESIILSHLQNIGELRKYYNDNMSLEDFMGIEDEKKKKEIDEKKEKSTELYYKIDKKKIKELEDTFKSEKLKVSLSNAGNLGKNKIY